MRPGRDQPIVADQIVGQAQAAHADRADEAPRQRVEIAKQPAVGTQIAAIGLRHPAIDRHTGGGIGMGVGGKVRHQRVDRPALYLRVAIQKDDGLLATVQQVMDEMVPGP